MASSHQNEQLSAVVLLAHGPAAATLTALRNLEALTADTGVEVVIVAGTEPGLTAVDRAIDRGAAGVVDHGPAALAEILADRTGMVLVVPDDTVLTPDVPPALVAEAARTGHVAVAPTKATSSASTADVANLLCASGSAEQLERLARESAFGPGVEANGPFAIPAGIAVSSTGEGRRRLVDPAHRTGGPLLVAALIVRDESEQIVECLDSLAGIVDRIEVADTGSLDDTVALARAAGANVEEIGWQDDFAWARNQVLERCTDADYMLWIDADERLVCDDPAHFRAVLATYGRLHPGYRFMIHNQAASGERTHSFMARRIANPKLVRFEGALHEQAVRLDGEPLRDAALAGVAIEHFGYEDALVAQRNKADRNLQIAREGHIKQADATSALHLARALAAASSDAEATLHELEPLAETILSGPDAGQSLFHSLCGQLHLAAGNLDAAIDSATAALELIPADATAGAVLAEALVQAGHIETVLETAADYAMRPSPTPLVDDRLAYQTRARIVFESAVHLGRFETAIEQCPDLPSDLDPWAALTHHGGLEVLLAAMDTAGTLNDGRYLRTLASLPDLTRAQLARCRSAFSIELDSDLECLLEEVADHLATVDDAPAALAQYQETGAAADAVRYAEHLTHHHLDLTIELEDIDRTPQPTATALAIAAESHRRARRSDDARAVANLALSIHPGSPRAASVLADHLLADDPESALRHLDAAVADDQFTRSPAPLQRDIATSRMNALLNVGQLRLAISTAVDLLDLGGEITDWAPFLDLAGEDLEALSVTLGLVLLTDGVAFIDALPQAVGPERTAVICATYLGMGGQNPEAVSVGVLAASMTGQIDLGCVIAGYASLLPAGLVDRLCNHLDRTDAARIAAALSAPQTLSA